MHILTLALFSHVLGTIKTKAKSKATRLSHPSNMNIIFHNWPLMRENLSSEFATNKSQTSLFSYRDYMLL